MSRNTTSRNTTSKQESRGLARGIIKSLIVLCLSIWQASSTVHGESSERPLTKSPNNNNLDDVAQEILEIQQELGGSVVDKNFPQQDPPASTSTPSAESTKRSKSIDGSESSLTLLQGLPSPTQQVIALRETARDLDRSAHRLESLDLYNQADLLREVAHKLRQTARLERDQQLANSEQPLQPHPIAR